ncbi:hypothetical protein AN215_23670 [Streptomyces abyssalis]|uniref:DUF3152 domain-containing protein n=1 Tax=Streptomyces abyssalis TaxID=933944 RepID=A0A1E7JIL2_9ACTN|nr:hypothetical protein AN215_23670 [Streptomyces abyssalis]
MRGGHPEHREPGGGWGADSSGRGPEGGNAAGRVLQGTPGAAVGMGRPATGPRQEYIEAFDDGVFGRDKAGGPSSLRAPAPRHPGAAGRAPGRSLPDPGPAPVRRPGGRRPGTPGPWNGYDGYDEPGDFAQSGRGGAGGHGPRGGPDADGGLPHAPPPRVPVQVPRTGKGGGHKGKAVTAVLAVAVTTVIAFVVAGQVADGGGPGGDGGEEGAAAERGVAADEPASRSDKGRGVPGQPQGAAPTYTEKLSKTFSLKSGFKGKGDFRAVPGSHEGAGGNEVMRYRVDVEKGLPLDSGLFAEAVQKTLNDKRSWARGGERSFERVAKGDVDFVITLASSPTTDVWCAKSGLDTSEQNVSCDSASTDRIMINAYRWAQGSKTFGDDRILGYRQMLINHEVGHRIGKDHVGCPKDGDLAPVMMQQTKSLTTDGAKCRPNPWPFPRG